MRECGGRRALVLTRDDRTRTHVQVRETKTGKEQIRSVKDVTLGSGFFWLENESVYGGTCARERLAVRMVL